MAERDKLELEYNIPCEIQLQYDSPHTGEGQYGPWYRYTVLSSDVEMSWFTTEDAYDRVQELGAGKGDLLVVTKRQAKEEGGTRRRDAYEIELKGNVPTSSEADPKRIPAQMLYAMQYAARAVRTIEGMSGKTAMFEDIRATAATMFIAATEAGVRLVPPRHNGTDDDEGHDQGRMGRTD